MTSKLRMPNYASPSFTNFTYTRLLHSRQKNLRIMSGYLFLMWLCLRLPTGHLNVEPVLRGIIFPRKGLDFANKRSILILLDKALHCFSSPSSKVTAGALSCARGDAREIAATSRNHSCSNHRTILTISAFFSCLCVLFVSLFCRQWSIHHPQPFLYRLCFSFFVHIG